MNSGFDSLAAVALLRRLKTRAHAITAEVEEFTREATGRRQAARRRQRETAAKANAWLEAELGAAREADATVRELLRQAHRNRRDRIQEAYRHALHAVQALAQRRKEQWLGNLQMRHFRAERQMPVETQAQANAHLEFEAALAVHQQRLAALELLARRSVDGYPALKRLLAPAETPAAEAAGRDESYAAFESALAAAEERLAEVRRHYLARVFNVLPFPALAGIFVLLGALAGYFLGATPTAWAEAGGATVGLITAAFGLHAVSLARLRPAGTALAEAMQLARRTGAAATHATLVQHEAERIALQEQYAREFAEIEEQWPHGEQLEKRIARERRQKLENQILRVMKRHAGPAAERLARREAGNSPRTAELEAAAQARRAEAEARLETELAAVDRDETARWAEAIASWEQEVLPAYAELARMNAIADSLTRPWSADLVAAWSPAQHFPHGIPFGRLELDLAAVPGGLPADPRLTLPGPPQIGAPLALHFPQMGSLLFETADSGDPQVIGALNQILLRLLSAIPPGKLTLTIIDPVGLGQNFAGLMHLGDYEETLINRRIWTQRDQIEERLQEMSEHIEKMIQMYLRNEFATITEYNAQAGSVAEKYHFLVVADFPAGFSETAAKRLQSIAVSGPRCGVFTLIHWDRRHPAPDGLVPEELRRRSLCLQRGREGLYLAPGSPEPGETLQLDPPPAPELGAELVHKIGRASIDSNRVEVPFALITPREEEFWTGETAIELRVPIGRTGATKLQYLAIGKGTRQHALFAGKTGSGKSTLFHVIITNLALLCSPEEVEFYLIDFKKGVEFKCYANQRLPHARVVAIESDREFGLSVLQRVDEELKRRGDIFRRLGVQDLAGYRRSGAAEPMPRTLLIIDEFQEFFVDDDAVAQGASLLFDRIVRQGRAFGIHVLLGSQTLGGAYTLARATLGQMAIRVALQCNEADAYLIMDDNNAAPRLLSRPGEGIYNDAAGAVEGNSPFQVVWLPDEERDRWLQKISAVANARQVHYPAPVVFEGNAPAEVRENELLERALAAAPTADGNITKSPAAWLGAPNSIKGPTEVLFRRQSGNHLLIVGQRDEVALSLLGIALISLAAQLPAGAARLYLLSGAGPGTPEAEWLAALGRALGGRLRIFSASEIGPVLQELAAAVQERLAGGEAGTPSLFLAIHGLQRFKKLRQEDEFAFSSGSDDGPSPGAQLGEILTEGSALGVHVLASIDSFANLQRALSRKALGEFELRVLFQMSANDSASLIESPKASSLGLHRALFYNEQEGYLETFRPYATPDAAWLRAAGEKLAP